MKSQKSFASGVLVGALAAVALLAAFVGAHAGNYGGVTVGSALFDIDFPGPESGADQEHAQSVSVLIGRKVNRWLALEAEYSQLGTYRIANSTSEINASINTLGVHAVATWRGAYLKLGAETHRMAATFDGHPETITGTGPVYGAGVALALNRDTTVRIGFDKHAGINDERVNTEGGVTRTYVALVIGL